MEFELHISILYITAIRLIRSHNLKKRNSTIFLGTDPISVLFDRFLNGDWRYRNKWIYRVQREGEYYVGQQVKWSGSSGCWSMCFFLLGILSNRIRSWRVFVSCWGGWDGLVTKPTSAQWQTEFCNHDTPYTDHPSLLMYGESHISNLLRRNSTPYEVTVHM